MGKTDTTEIDGLITGRVAPKIYAFETETVPNYLKVGDTYRPLEQRLDEWRVYFPNLKLQYSDIAKVDDETFFRDFAVHYYLENIRNRQRLQPNNIPDLPYYSREFFKNASVQDVKDALKDIKEAFERKDNKYQYYKFDDSLIPEDYHFERTEDYEPRPNQKETIKNFKNATEAGRTNLLMYAVVRFGKSFTSMCCAVEMGAKLVVAVSAKADVKPEWQKTVESHYGVRAEEYGKVLGLSGNQLKKQLKDADTSEEYDDNTTLKELRSRVRIHLSGTPYRILMSSEFEKDDIIAFYQFSDIVKDKEEWDKKHLNKDDAKEWDNPYYGFPQMIRFAFNPSKRTLQVMEDMRKNGVTYAFSELFKPQSISKDTSGNQLHKKFEHEKEVLDLFEVIDGSKEDDTLLSFLDYDKIKEGKLCRHIVCVLPYRTSCDALEALIKKSKKKFKNLQEYEIINIAGVDDERTYKDTQSVKRKIKKCEKASRKTMTLTVNRMLTGATVAEWDTMMQEQKSQIYNVNADKNGNDRLEDRIKEELRISPIITLNKGKIHQIKPSVIMDAVRQYSANRSVMDEARDIPADIELLDNEEIRNAIKDLSPIDAKKGLNIKPAEGEGDDLNEGKDDENKDDGKNGGDKGGKDTPKYKEETGEDWKKKLATYYAEILFYAFLTDSEVKSLDKVIETIDANKDNKRIANNVGLRKDVLKLIRKFINPFKLSKLDYKIANLNTLKTDTSLSPVERARKAMNKFGRLSSSEIVTPEKVAKEMVGLLPEKDIK